MERTVKGSPEMHFCGIVYNILSKDPQISAKFSSDYQKSHILLFQTLPILQQKNFPSFCRKKVILSKFKQISWDFLGIFLSKKIIYHLI